MSQIKQDVQSSHSEINDQFLQLQLLLDDLENWSRRQNIRLRGVPESIPQSELSAMVISVFNQYLDRPRDTAITIDCVHRTLGSNPNPSDRPRDVLCCLHSFNLKEEILRQAWRVGVLEFDGVAIHLLLDISRRTLMMRRALKPLLDGISEKGLTYKWGHPFHLIVRKGANTFTLRLPSEFPHLFTFAEMNPVAVPNWLLVNIQLNPQRRPLDGRQQRVQTGRRSQRGPPQVPHEPVS